MWSRGHQQKHGDHNHSEQEAEEAWREYRASWDKRQSTAEFYSAAAAAKLWATSTLSRQREVMTRLKRSRLNERWDADMTGEAVFNLERVEHKHDVILSLIFVRALEYI